MARAPSGHGAHHLEFVADIALTRVLSVSVLSTLYVRVLSARPLEAASSTEHFSPRGV